MTLEQAKKNLIEYLEYKYSTDTKKSPLIIEFYRSPETARFLIHFINLFEKNQLIDDIPINKIYEDVYGDRIQYLKDFQSYLAERNMLNDNCKSYEYSNFYYHESNSQMDQVPQLPQTIHANNKGR